MKVGDQVKWSYQGHEKFGVVVFVGKDMSTLAAWQRFTGTGQEKSGLTQRQFDGGLKRLETVTLVVGTAAKAPGRPFPVYAPTVAISPVRKRA